MNILNVIPLMDFRVYGYILLYFSITLSISGVVSLVVGTLRDISGLVKLGWISFALSAIMAVLALLTPKDSPTGINRYECTLDETVSVIDIYDKYNVVDRRGDIWVLEDK